MNAPEPTVRDQQDTIHVLHVDDDEAVAETTTTFLEREDDRFSVEFETGATEGLEYLVGERVDCVVSDYEMPEMDGIEFLERVREDYPDLPFVLFTGKGSEAVASDAISAGVSDYLQKDVGSQQYELLANRIRNVVERYRAQQNYRELFEKVHVGLTIHDPDTGVITDVNRTFEDFVGYDRERLVGTHPGDLSPDDSPFTREKANNLFDRALTEGPQRFEWRDRTEAGESRWVEVTLKPTVIDGRQRVLAAVQDVTGRKEDEQALEAAKQKFETVFENSNDAVFIVDIETERILDCNPAATDLLGYSHEELLSMSIADLHPHNYRDLMAFAETVIEEGQGWTDELTCYGNDDERIPAEISAAVCEIDGRTCLVSSIRDISERRERERTLETKERLFEAVFNNPDTFTGILDPDGTVRRINETALDFMESSHDDVTGQAFPELAVWAHSADLQSDLREWIDRAAAGEFVRFEADNEAPDGKRVTIDGFLLPVFDDEGTVTHAVAAGRDITERKARERELEETASHLRTVMETVPGAVFLADRDDRTVLMSEFGKEFLGFEDEPLEGRKLQEFASDRVPSEQIDQIEQMHRETIETETRIERELELPAPGGTRTVRAITAPYYAGNDEPAGICGVAVDITEQKTRQNELARTNERLDAFASVVSHDLRNPLSVAQGQLELASEECESEHLDTVSSAHNRMDSLITDLLALARGGGSASEVEQVAVGDLIESCWSTVATADATLAVESERQIEADSGRLKQLFENLFRNAVEHGGEDVTVTVGGMEDGFYVEDDGPGIPEDDRDAVFEAGYSTLEEGTGFGLSIVKQVVDAHDWEVRVTDGIEGGARFEITTTR